MPVQFAPPPVIATPAPALARWLPGEVRCADGAVRTIQAPAPRPVLRYGSLVPADAVFGFTVAADGRALDIRATASDRVFWADDLAPSLAAARFAPGARTGCSIRFTAMTQPIATAPMADVFAFAAYQDGPLPQPVLGRIRAASGDCGETRPAPLLRAFPDMDKLPRTPGALGWTVTRYDLDARGVPVHAITAASSGDSALDRAASEALGRSRFAGGAARGCIAPTGLRAATLAAPPPPAIEPLRPAGATCPAELAFATPTAMAMPDPWRRRAIEGWAVVAYDVAPWSAIGNARVLAAQPAAAFGDWALTVIRPATKKTSNTGYTGCVERVLFRMADGAKLPPVPPADELIVR